MITSLQNPLVKHFTKLRLDSTYREEQKAILVEGTKIISELKVCPKKVVYTPDFSHFSQNLSGEKIEVNAAVFQKITGSTQSEGVIAEFPLPAYHLLEEAKNLLVFDAVSDPGNLGTLMRTALAFGWKNFYFLPGCCDPYNEKVIRAARGTHFKAKMSRGTAKTLKEWKEKTGLEAYSADLYGVNPGEVSASSPKMIILGNEGHGISDEVRHFSNAITIPMSGNMESLNVAVAGGILLYLFSEGKK